MSHHGQGTLSPLKHAAHGSMQPGGAPPGGFMHRSEPSLHNPRSQSHGSGNAAKRPGQQGRKDLGPLPPPMTPGLDHRAVGNKDRGGTSDPLRMTGMTAASTAASSHMGVSDGFGRGVGPQASHSPLRTGASYQSKTDGFQGYKGSPQPDWRGPDPNPRSPFLVVQPQSWSRSASPSMDRVKEPSLESYRPAFRTDWLMALRREILEGMQAECFMLRRDFHNSINEIQNNIQKGVVDTQMGVQEICGEIVAKGIKDVRSDLIEALLLDGQAVKPITSFGKREVLVDFNPVLELVAKVNSEVKSKIAQTNTASSQKISEQLKTSTERAEKERENVLREIERSHLSLRLIRDISEQEVRDNFSILGDKIDATVSKTKTAHLDPILTAVERMDVKPAVDLSPLMDAIKNIDLSSITEQIAKVADQEVDLGPVTAMLKDQGLLIDRISTSVQSSHVAIEGIQSNTKEAHAAIANIDGSLKKVSETVDSVKEVGEASKDAAASASLGGAGMAAVASDVEIMKTSVAATADILNEIRSEVRGLEEVKRFAEAAKTASELSAATIVRIEANTKTDIPECVAAAGENMVKRVQDATAMGSVTKSLIDIAEKLEGLGGASAGGSSKVDLSPLLKQFEKFDCTAKCDGLVEVCSAMQTLLDNAAKESDVDFVSKQVKELVKSLTQSEQFATSKFASIEKTVGDVALQHEAETKRIEEAIGKIDVQPTIDLTEIKDVVNDISKPLMREIKNIQPTLDSDFKKIKVAIAESSERNSEANTKFETAFRRVEWSLKHLKALECTLLTFSQTTQQVDERNGKLLGSLCAKVEEMHAKPPTDLTPMLTEVKEKLEETQKGTLEKMDEQHKITSRSLDDFSTSIHTEVNNVHVVSREINFNTKSALDDITSKQVEMRETVENIHAKPPTDLSGVIASQKRTEDRQIAHKKEIMEEVVKTQNEHLLPLAKHLEKLDAKPPTDLSPVLADLTRLHGTCGATLHAVRGPKEAVKSILWTTPTAAFS